MNIYALTALLNLIASSFLGIFVYSQNPKSVINRTFALFCFFITIWSGAYIFWQISDIASQALFWSRALMAGTIFVSISYFHFVVVFVNKIQKYKKYLFGGYALLSLFFLANFTSYFVKGVVPKLQFPFWPEPGILYHPFLLLWVSFIVFTFYLLFKEHRTASGVLKTQIKYILLGTIVGYLGGLTNYLLWYDIPIPPIGNWAVTFYLGIVAYTIVTQRLFDIRVILTQILVGVISVLLFINLVSSQTLFEYFWKGSLFVAFLIAGYLLVRSVMNEIKQREELQRAYAKLKELDEAKSEFVSIASHQLRTPLTAIKGYMSMILEGSYGNLNETQQKPMKSVYESNERLIRLVNDLLNISRIESGRVDMKWAKKNIADIIQSTIDEIGIKAQEKKLKLVFEKPEESLPELSLDEEKIRNVLLNILDNAIRYTKKGKITIKTHLKEEYPKGGKSVVVEVKDTGDGMTQEELNHLFESFSRGGAGTRMSTEGAGLGLYIAKQFVNLHKGKIWAESQGRGEGSTFFVELPIQ